MVNGKCEKTKLSARPYFRISIFHFPSEVGFVPSPAVGTKRGISRAAGRKQRLALGSIGFVLMVWCPAPLGSRSTSLGSRRRERRDTLGAAEWRGRWSIRARWREVPLARAL